MTFTSEYSDSMLVCNDTHCICKDGFEGHRCESCSRGYWGYPDCKGITYIDTKFIIIAAVPLL